MKTLLIALCALVGLWCGQVIAQSQEGLHKEKMKLFSGWVGQWQGEGSMQMGPGEPKKSSVLEKIEWRLDGTVLLVEGLGKSLNPSTNEQVVTHNALAVLSYDAASNEYKFKTYLKDGRSTDAWLKSTGENTFQWGFDIPARGKTRYSITLDPSKKTWNEIGEYSADSTSWSKFFEMNLVKI
jgi:hypothetical protein